MGRALILGLAVAICGCSNEPTQRQIKNARVFEAMLTAVSLRNAKEFEQDARLINERYDAGEISEAKYKELAEIIEKGRAGDWAGAEARAYEFRAQFGDSGSFFD